MSLKPTDTAVISKSRDHSPNFSENSVIKDLVKKRGIIKGRLSRFANYISSIEGVLLSNQTCVDLKMRITGAASLYNEFNEIQSKLEESVSDVEEQLTHREQFEDSYYSILSQAECLLKQTQVTDSSATHQRNSIKLPTISLPTFDGSYEQWLEFRDTFTSLVHNCKDLSNIEKFHYLKSSLKKGAELVIDSVEFSSNNYVVAWELLLSRYDNSRLLVHNHVKALFTMPSLSKESPVLLRRLIETVLKNLRALKILGEPTDSWDTLIIYLMVSKLDHTTEREWEQHKGNLYSNNCDSKLNLTVEHLMSFLKNRADMLETLQASHYSNHRHILERKQPSTQITHTKHHCNVSVNKALERTSRNPTKKLCLLCHTDHPLYSCQKFLDYNLQSKLKFINDMRLCINCLRPGHTVDNCRFGPCRMCNKKHNSLVHPYSHDNTSNSNRSATLPSSHANVANDQLTVPCGERSPRPVSPAPALPLGTSSALSVQVPTGRVNKQHIKNMHCAPIAATVTPVLLSTALVEIADIHNNYHLVRALLDSGSQRCFITKALSDLLQAPIIQSTHEIRGVGNSITKCTQTCDVEIKSRSNTYTTRLQCFVLSSITSALPAIAEQLAHFNIPEHIILADPQFNESRHIDILIGADKFWDLMNNNKIKLPNGPFLLDTKLGWVLSGPICSISRSYSPIQCSFSHTIETQLRQFWELEETPVSRDSRTDEERACEQHFVENTTRNIDGRFCVRIPLITPPEALGDSYAQAERRFLALERRLLINPNYRQLYSDFMEEYIRLGHMTRIDHYGTPHYVMPHHGVFREHSTTTKLRVVFDASAVSTTGRSLNDLQMVGPPIQGDLISILLRFRQHKYTACADIEKMYRQVLIDADQRQLQLILWRDDPSQPISVYQLNTVTYGTASAPYLSCRCLKQLAADCKDQSVARVVYEDFYVDDMITGSDNKDELLKNCQGVVNLLKSGCFTLRKWMFNFEFNDTDNNASDLGKELTLGENCNSNTLGVGWFNVNDEFYFNTQFKFKNKLITKRYILSNISQIFDPLGLLSPVIIVIKILLQKLWLLKTGFDDEVPANIAQIWDRFATSLSLLKELRIPRHVIGSDPRQIELHVFSDASESAYGTCIYVRTINHDSSITVRLYCSKSKVAPLRPVSTPRLELLGALTSVRLFNKLRNSINCNFSNIVFWCDSTIVLGWLRMAPNLLKTFVQNRVCEIHDIAKDLPWCHVRGKDNPADLVSRGVKLEDLQSCSLWWNGPAFLNDPNFDCNLVISKQSHIKQMVDLPEVKQKPLHSFVAESTNFFFPFENFSQFNRMKRACAYMLRFIHNTRNKNNRYTGDLSVDELIDANRTLIKLSQRESYAEEFNLLSNNRNLKSTNNINKLNLFLDNDKIIRVGGRITYSQEFNFDKKHPMLLSSKHQYTILLFRDEHRRLHHAAPQSLLYNIRESYWPVGGRNLARRTVHQCVTCVRLKGKTLSPIMGNLPQGRITPSFPFLRCGVDYAGPVLTLNRKGRGSKLVKSYICIFVCFVTRAVHIELVSDLSSESYLLALKRFISRRGKPVEITSDNGRNFVGLANEFSKFLSTRSRDIKEYATSQNIKFTFIPPYAAHFGGLWESGVRSCKHHLLRVVGNAHLTFEEMTTVLVQIEAVLNSRPISPMSADPNDLLPLSPAHFLVGRSLTAPITEQLTEIPVHRLTRYQRLEQIKQNFWNRWSKEYISEMQTRSKWRENKPDLQPNTLVVIKEDNSPPLKWSLGRIISTQPGKDGVSRVADIRTTSGVIRRAFPRICPLPVAMDGDEDVGGQ